jgi:hypothetical protein
MVQGDLRFNGLRSTSQCTDHRVFLRQASMYRAEPQTDAVRAYGFSRSNVSDPPRYWPPGPPASDATESKGASR